MQPDHDSLWRYREGSPKGVVAMELRGEVR